MVLAFAAQGLIGMVALITQRVVCKFAFLHEDRRRRVGMTSTRLEQLVRFVARHIKHGIGVLACDMKDRIRIVARQLHHGVRMLRDALSWLAATAWSVFSRSTRRLLLVLMRCGVRLTPWRTP